MGLDLWFREDVMRILASTYETMRASLSVAVPEGAGRTDAYERGFTDALRTVALAFGLAFLNAERGTGYRPAQGAAEVLPREELAEESEQPRWRA
jgi:hypothetical protein